MHAPAPSTGPPPPARGTSLTESPPASPAAPAGSCGRHAPAGAACMGPAPPLPGPCRATRCRRCCPSPHTPPRRHHAGAQGSPAPCRLPLAATPVQRPQAAAPGLRRPPRPGYHHPLADRPCPLLLLLLLAMLGLSHVPLGPQAAPLHTLQVRGSQTAPGCHHPSRRPPQLLGLGRARAVAAAWAPMQPLARSVTSRMARWGRAPAAE